MSDAATQQRALWAALLVVFLWGSNFAVQKMTFSAFGPGGFLFARGVLLAALAAVLLRWRYGRIWPRLGRADWRALVLVTLAGPLGHIVVTIHGIHWSTAFSSALIMSCGPVITLLLLRLLHGTPLGRQRMLGVAVAFAGMLLYMSEKLLASHWRAGAGDLVVLAGAVLFSLYTIWLAPMVERHGGVQVTCWTTLLSTPPTLLLFGATAARTPYGDAAPMIWVLFLWSVLMAAFLGWILWGWAISVLGVARGAPMMYMVPPVAGVVAWATVGESFGLHKIAGAALALAGVAWTQFGPGAAAAPARVAAER